MLNPKTFRCKRCGECCNKYVIKLSKRDIDRINKLDYKDFFEYDGAIHSMVLKKINNRCIFIKKKKDKFFCQIYKFRPLVCRRYPFFRKNIENCKPITFKSMQ